MKYIHIILLILFILPYSAEQASPIQLRVHGEPTPYSFVSIFAESSFLDLTNTTIEWSADGEPIHQGKGAVKQDIFLEDPGYPKEIRVRAITSQGAVEETLIILPGILDVLWEAQTVTPPFFRGKAIPTDRSIIRAMAIPYWDKSIPQKDIFFSWKKDSTIALSKTKEIASTQMIGAWEGKTLTIDTTAEFSGHSLTKKTTIPTQNVRPLFYRIHPFTGVETKNTLTNQEYIQSPTLSLLAVPFGLSIEDAKKNKVLFEWKVNSQTIEHGVGLQHSRITFAKNEQEKNGTISIFLKVQNTVNVMQYGEAHIQWNTNSNTP